MNLAKIFVSFPHGVGVFDRSSRPVFMNPAFHETFNIPASSPDTPISDIFINAPEVVTHIGRLFAAGTSLINHDFIMDTGKGTKKSVALHIQSIDFGGPQTGAVVITQENVGKLEIQSEFEKDEKMAMFSMITAGLAHEIKNPLSGIRGAAQLIGKENKDLSEYCRLIIEETDRINSLVSELMEIGTVRRHKREKANIHKILDEILLLLEREFAKRRITVVRDYEPSLPPVTVEGDRLKQTFINLIKNSIEAVGADGQVRVRTRTAMDPTPMVGQKARKGMMMSVEIIDTGKGISPEVAKHLFTPFNTSKKRGTGLGLVISLKIIRDHGGVLTLENNPLGTGATARALIPLA